MIPKIIHYCWFGKQPLPYKVKQFINTWVKYCPDYQIKQWNEDNFNVHSIPYTKEAYQQKKWAFVSDVARLNALVHEGGIYMDTDVEVIKSLDTLLDNQAFLGFEGTKFIATNMMGAEANHPFLKHFLDSYQTRHFIKEDGSLDLTTNVEIITQKLLHSFNLKLNGKEQDIDAIHVYPSDYFSPYDYINGTITRTNNTYTIHWFEQSWTKKNKFITKIIQLYHRIIGTKM